MPSQHLWLIEFESILSIHFWLNLAVQDGKYQYSFVNVSYDYWIGSSSKVQKYQQPAVIQNSIGVPCKFVQ